MSRVQERVDRSIVIDGVGGSAPLQLRQGTDDGDVLVVIERPQVGVSAEVRVKDLRTGLTLLEVQE